MLLVGRVFPALLEVVCLPAEAFCRVDRDISSPLREPGLRSSWSVLSPLLAVVLPRRTLVEVE